jgi:type IV secretion system protein VirB2
MTRTHSGSSRIASSNNLKASRKAFLFLLLLIPTLAFAQASPFETGANALQDNLLTIMTPIAIILIIALGIGAMVNRISWSWAIAAIAGVALTFGAPQIVTWLRGAFGV